ncbi:TPA: hypothetical protein IXT14_003070 [Enterococcus faecium]|nr:hypothetical protein [Enterococcus faecium]HAQ4843651.1 hypothetical protein [Enterococcus faecium]
MRQVLLVVTLCLSFFLFEVNTVEAYVVNNGVYYNLIQGGTQEFMEVDEEGNPILIRVEEVPGLSLFSVNNGNYKISGSKFGMWKANYYVTVSNNQFIRAYSPSAVAVTGSFTSTRLSLVSSKKASYTLEWKAGILSSNSYLDATLTDNSINITY